MLRPSVPHSESLASHGSLRRRMLWGPVPLPHASPEQAAAVIAAARTPSGCGSGMFHSGRTLYSAGLRHITAAAAGHFGRQQALLDHRAQPQQGRSSHVVQGTSTARVASTVATSTEPIQWGCYLSRKAILADAVDECIAQVTQAMRADPQWPGEFQPELAIIFISSAYGREFDSLIPMLTERLPSLKTVFGCSVRAWRARTPVACMHARACCPTTGPVNGPRAYVHAASYASSVPFGVSLHASIHSHSCTLRQSIGCMRDQAPCVCKLYTYIAHTYTARAPDAASCAACAGFLGPPYGLLQAPWADSMCWCATCHTQAFGVMGGSKSGTTEVDGEPALSLTLGRLPGVSSTGHQWTATQQGARCRVHACI